MTDQALTLGVPDSLVEAIAARAAELVLEQLQAERANGPAAKYLNVEEAAAYIAGSKQRVYDLLSAGRLTRFKDGSRVLVAREEVDAYLAGTRVGRVAHPLPNGSRGRMVSGVQR